MNGSGEAPRPEVTLEPLTRRNRNGTAYEREAWVERQIRSALDLPPEALRSRAGVSDRESPEYLSEESLVYLIRYLRRRAESQSVNDLTAALLRRLVSIVWKHLGSLGPEAVKEGESEVIDALFRRILDIDTDKADFLQVRFWVVIESLCVQAFQRQLRARKRTRSQVELSALPGYDGPDAEQSDAATLTEEELQRVSVQPLPAARLDIPFITLALSQLPENLRSAFLLRHYYEWPIEDADPTVPTISRHLNRTPRTIRTWLNEAERLLANWRGGQR